MKRLVLLGLVLVVVFGGLGKALDCQYTTNETIEEEVINFYENGTLLDYTVLEATEFTTGAWNSWYGRWDVHPHFKVFNHYHDEVNVTVRYIYYGDAVFRDLIIDYGGYEQINYDDTPPVEPVDPESISYEIHNDYLEALRETIFVDNITCKICGEVTCLNDGEDCDFDFECGSGVCSDSGDTVGKCISEATDLELRIVALESWQQTIDDWRVSVMDTLSGITDSLTSLFTTTDDHETRITTLEAQNQTPPQDPPNATLTSYWKYLDFRTKEDVACGWGIDNEMTRYKMEDLGASCEIEYTRGRARCDCEEVVGECDLDSPLYCYSWELRRDNLNFEVKNIGTQDVDIVSVQVDGCEFEDRGGRIRAGSDRRMRIDCTEDFEEGNILINYLDEDEVSHISEGFVRIS